MKKRLIWMSCLFFTMNAFAWKMDDRTRFNLAYLPETSPQTMGDAHPYLSAIPSYLPDIDNIIYANIRELGFPFPERENPKELKLYLKIYEAPLSVNVQKTSSDIFNRFHLSKIKGGDRFYRYVRERKNVLIKYALIDRANRIFSEKNPMLSPHFQKLTQKDFDLHIPYSSIYVAPDKAPKNAEESARAVSELYQLILAEYQKMMSLKETKKDGTMIFEMGKDRLEIRTPLIFKNYKELPMPQGKTLFLSGLLLIKYTDLKEGKDQMLEIASVFDEMNYR